PMVVGTLGQRYNFHLGFGVAAIGMFIGLVTFVLTKKNFLSSVGSKAPNPLKPAEKKKTITVVSISSIIIILVGTLFNSLNIFTLNIFTIIISVLAVIIPIIYFIIMYKSPKTTKKEQSNLIAYIPLFIAAVLFFSILEQGSIILATFADTRTSLEFLGFGLESRSEE